MDSTVLKLKLDDSSKWNSTLDMMERLHMVKEPLISVYLSLFGYPPLPTEHWIILEDLVMLLKPFKMLTVHLTQEHRSTLGNVIPLIRDLKNSIYNIKPKTSSGLFFKDSLVYNVLTDFCSIEQIEKSFFYVKASILDPRFKKAALTINSDSAEHGILTELAVLLKNKKDCDADKIDIVTTGQPTAVQKNEQAEVAINITATALIKEYMDLTYLHLSRDPIKFWETHNSLLGPLSEVALKYACIPACSVPSEIIFSKDGEVESKRRNKLSPKNIDVMIFLNKNLGN